MLPLADTKSAGLGDPFIFGGNIPGARLRNALIRADPDAGRPWRHACSVVQNSRFGATSGGHLGDEVADQMGGYFGSLGRLRPAGQQGPGKVAFMKLEVA
jgi:hypothetical protein